MFRRANERMELTLRGSNDLIWDFEMPTETLATPRRYHVIAGSIRLRPPPSCRDRPDRSDDSPGRPRLCQGGRDASPWPAKPPSTRGKSDLSHTDGSIRTVLVRGVRCAIHGKTHPLRGHRRDITDLKHAEEDLRRAKEEWERTFDSVPDLIAILDEHHQVIRANRAMARRLGTTPQQCVGLPCYQVVHGTDAPPSFCPACATLRDLRSTPKKSTRTAWAATSLSPPRRSLTNRASSGGRCMWPETSPSAKRAEEALRQGQRGSGPRSRWTRTDGGFLTPGATLLTWTDETYGIFG